MNLVRIENFFKDNNVPQFRIRQLRDAVYKQYATEWDEIKTLVGRARFMVVPSEWYENNPLSVIEAKSLGTPVLGADIGGIPELIQNGVSGMTFESRNVADLKEKIELMYAVNFDYAHIAEMSKAQYGAEDYYDRLMKIY